MLFDDWITAKAHSLRLIPGTFISGIEESHVNSFKSASNLEVDVIAVGSGMGSNYAALAAQAQGLETDILEKSGKFGGGTTYSFGIAWVGDNHLEPSMGVQESREDAYTY